MKKAIKAGDLRRLALSKGAELVIDGKPFNSTRQVVKGKQKPADKPEPEQQKAPEAPKPQPAPPAKAEAIGITRAELVQLLDEREAALRRDIQHLHVLLAQMAAKPPAPPPRGPTRIAVQYDASGAIVGLVANPESTQPAPADSDGWPA